jgi:hypothetical protein
MAAYFTSEAAAREDERKEPPPELKVQMKEMAALSWGAGVLRPQATLAVLPTLSWPHLVWELASWLGLSGGAGERLTLPLTVAGDLGKRRSAQR